MTDSKTTTLFLIHNTLIQREAIYFNNKKVTESLSKFFEKTGIKLDIKKCNKISNIVGNCDEV